MHIYGLFDFVCVCSTREELWRCNQPSKQLPTYELIWDCYFKHLQNTSRHIESAISNNSAWPSKVSTFHPTFDEKDSRRFVQSFSRCNCFRWCAFSWGINMLWKLREPHPTHLRLKKIIHSIDMTKRLGPKGETIKTLDGHNHRCLSCTWFPLVSTHATRAALFRKSEVHQEER